MDGPHGPLRGTCNLEAARQAEREAFPDEDARLGSRCHVSPLNLLYYHGEYIANAVPGRSRALLRAGVSITALMETTDSGIQTSGSSSRRTHYDTPSIGAISQK